MHPFLSEFHGSCHYVLAWAFRLWPRFRPATASPRAVPERAARTGLHPARPGVVFAVLLFLAMFLLAGQAMAASLPRGLNVKMPLSVDMAAHSVSFLAEVNTAESREQLRHFAVDKEGEYADKALLKAWISPRQLHDSLVMLGLAPGDNMTMGNWNTQHVEGAKLSVTLYFEATGKTVDITELVRDQPGNAQDGRGLDMRFGGNFKAATGPDASGCLICLFSCPMGIVSNHETLYKETGSMGPVRYKALGAPENGGWAVVTIGRK